MNKVSFIRISSLITFV